MIFDLFKSLGDPPPHPEWDDKPALAQQVPPQSYGKVHTMPMLPAQPIDNNIGAILRGEAGASSLTFPNTSNEALLAHIDMRLRTPPTKRRFDWMAAYKDGDTVHVWVVVSSKSVTFEDGWNLFPSDNLIAQLALLSKDVTK